MENKNNNQNQTPNQAPRPAQFQAPRPPYQSNRPNQFNQQQQNKNRNDFLMNERIRFPELRVISSTGEQLGIMKTYEALRLAKDEDLDLVVISPNQKPPIAKILDYGKYKFEKEKHEKEQKKKTKNQNALKELKLTPRIDPHDLEVKIRKINEWLEEGNKVRIVIAMRGREIQHTEISIELLQNILKETSEHGKSDRTPAIKQEGKSFSIQLVPLVALIP